MRAIAEPRAKPKAECFYRPYGTDLPFASFPSTSYWATFTESLRDKSPHRTILALKLTRMGVTFRLRHASREPRDSAELHETPPPGRLGNPFQSLRLERVEKLDLILYR